MEISFRIDQTLHSFQVLCDISLWLSWWRIESAFVLIKVILITWSRLNLLEAKVSCIKGEISILAPLLHVEFDYSEGRILDYPASIVPLNYTSGKSEALLKSKLFIRLEVLYVVGLLHSVVFLAHQIIELE